MSALGSAERPLRAADEFVLWRNGYPDFRESTQTAVNRPCRPAQCTSEIISDLQSAELVKDERRRQGCGDF